MESRDFDQRCVTWEKLSKVVAICLKLPASTNQRRGHASQPRQRQDSHSLQQRRHQCEPLYQSHPACPNGGRVRARAGQPAEYAQGHSHFKSEKQRVQRQLWHRRLAESISQNRDELDCETDRETFARATPSQGGTAPESATSPKSASSSTRDWMRMLQRTKRAVSGETLWPCEDRRLGSRARPVRPIGESRTTRLMRSARPSPPRSRPVAMDRDGSRNPRSGKRPCGASLESRERQVRPTQARRPPRRPARPVALPAASSRFSRPEMVPRRRVGRRHPRKARAAQPPTPSPPSPRRRWREDSSRTRPATDSDLATTRGWHPDSQGRSAKTATAKHRAAREARPRQAQEMPERPQTGRRPLHMRPPVPKTVAAQRSNQGRCPRQSRERIDGRKDQGVPETRPGERVESHNRHRKERQPRVPRRSAIDQDSQ